MNKYLLMCAAAALAATASGGFAQAGTTVHLCTTGGSSCDWFVIHYSGGGLYAAVHHAPGATSVQYDAGQAGHSKVGAVTGKWVQFADTTLAICCGLHDGLDFVLGKPFGYHSPWVILANTNDNTTFVLNHGYETNKVRPGAGKESVLSTAIKALQLRKL